MGMRPSINYVFCGDTDISDAGKRAWGVCLSACSACRTMSDQPAWRNYPSLLRPQYILTGRTCHKPLTPAPQRRERKMCQAAAARQTSTRDSSHRLYKCADRQAPERSASKCSLLPQLLQQKCAV